MALGLGACVSTTEPVSVGNGSFMIATNARGGMRSDGDLTADTIRQAHDFCRRQGKTEAVVEDTANKGVQGWTPQNARVTFHCR